MKEFYAVHGHYKVPRGYVTENGINLGSWRRTQMHRYKYGTLNEKYLQMIKDAGIMEMLESPFDTAYRHALEFYKIYGNLEMQTGYTCPDGFNLGKWCASIRDNRKKGKVSEDKIALLDELGFDWSTIYINGLSNRDNMMMITIINNNILNNIICYAFFCIFKISHIPISTKILVL